MNTSKRSHTNWLLVILFLSALGKLVVLFNMPAAEPPLYVSHDTVSYVESARALLYTGTFSISLQNPAPQTIRTPGYPLLLTLVYGLFGQNDLAVLIAQIGFSLGTIAMVYWIGSRLWNSRVGLAASLLIVLDLNSAGFSLSILTETLFTFFLTAFLAAVVAIINLDPRREGKRIAYFAFLAGLLIALATHTRPITYYLVVPVLAVWIVWGLWWKKYPPRTLSFSLLAFIVPCLVLIGGWQARNYMLTGSAQFCTIESVNLVNYRAAMILAERDGISRDDAMQEIYTRFNLNREEQGWNEEWRNSGLQVIKENPSISVLQTLKGLVNICAGPGSEEIARFAGTKIEETSPLGDLLRISWDEYIQRWVLGSPYYFGVFVFSMLHMLLIYSGLAIWFVRSLKNRNWVFGEMILFLTALYLALVSAGPEAYYRFRVPMTPALVLLAGSVLVNILTKKHTVSNNQISRSDS